MIHDISVVTDRDLVTWEDSEPGFRYEWTSQIGPDVPANVSVVTVGSHTGTHLDAPLHFIETGTSVQSIPLEKLLGPVFVAELPNTNAVNALDLENAQIPVGTKRLILKTRNSIQELIHDTKFHKEYVGVAPSGAQWIVDHAIELVGVDYLSVGPYGTDNIATHRILLSASVVVVEALELTNVPQGIYWLACLPAKVAHVEGAPCRAVLIDLDTLVADTETMMR